MARADKYTQDYYSTLGVSAKADSKEIKVAFRRLARQYHPDLNPNDAVAAEKFKQISQAYDILSDTVRRRRYDLRPKQDSGKKRASSSTNSTTTYYSSKKTDLPRTAEEYFQRGTHYKQIKEYAKAISDYTKAISLNPQFVDAYLKRCEMRYKMGDNQGVLDDCYKILVISPRVAKAHYYQGRARYSLGYSQPAIDCYSLAISQDGNYPQAYYYRGIAYRELKNTASAINDFNKAADLFRLQRNHEAYRRTRKMVEEFSGKKQVLGWFESIIHNFLMTLSLSFFNPAGGLLPAYSRLTRPQLKQTGIIYGSFSALCFVCSYFMMGLPIAIPLWQLSMLGTIPFISLIVTGVIVRCFWHHRGDFATDIFIAGVTISPLAFFAILGGFVPLTAVFVQIALVLVGCAYTVMGLYTSYAQLLNISESQSSFLVALMLFFNVYFACISISALV